MESENGVPTEEEKIVVDVKEEENVSEKTNANEEKADETPSVKTELSENVPKSKTSSQRKLGTGGTTKNNKMAQDQAILRGTAALTHSKKASISQSVSFPSRGVSSDVMRKSIDVYPKKSDAKDLKTKGVKNETSLSNGSSAFSLNAKGVSAGVLKNANANGGVATSRRTTIAAVPSLRQSMSGKSLLPSGSAKKATSEVSNDENKKPTKAAVLPLKEDEDARSTTSSSTTPRGQRRASITGFSFRLEERAEKRKEFLAKIEEKIQAKEEEKNNMQAKSKIPTTRAVSPKLGRNKNSTSTTNSSESGGSCFSPRVVKEQVKSPTALLSTSDKVTGASKGKPIETKKLMKSSLTGKTKVKAVGTKSKPAEVKNLDENICEENPQDMHDKPADEKCEMNPADDSAVQLSSTVVITALVTVEG